MNVNRRGSAKAPGAKAPANTVSKMGDCPDKVCPVKNAVAMSGHKGGGYKKVHGTVSG